MKPVAYITKYDLERLPLYDCWVNGEKSKGSVPLYTLKKLTQDEILSLWKSKHETCVYISDLFAFANAILKKASEQ
jgi:hypothetical protein